LTGQRGNGVDGRHDEKHMKIGVKALVNVALEYLSRAK
jgi:hypothetical protein